MAALSAALLLVCFAGLSHAASASAAAAESANLSYYLGHVSSDASEDAERLASVPTPESVLGWQVGDWHVRHDQLVRYFESLAVASDRVSLEITGYTHEQRPTLLAAITSPANQARLEELRNVHSQWSDLGAESSLPPVVVVYLGYSVHGNEPSGSNASLLVAYHLASSQDPAIRELLERTIVLIDPSLNPDGLSRFAQWANMHKGNALVADPEHREHAEGWPNGRTNHYWFDLNRDWLLAQHPESRARLRAFHRWRPNVLADFHEMGSNSSYFFQPGVPERKNPQTPEENVQLTAAFAEYHAKALDEIGSLYYSEEVFDDFYYGKGSTYPDIHGAVGILFEQASSRGHLHASAMAKGGELSFPFTIRNQVTTSFSTLRAADAMRDRLLDYQRRFFRDAETQAGDWSAQSGRSGWLVGDADDATRTAHFAQLMRAHGVEIHDLKSRITHDGQTFEPGSAFIIPARQRQYRLIRAMLDRGTKFQDSTFYDISTWSLPAAFDLPMVEIDAAMLEQRAGERNDQPTLPTGRVASSQGAVAYAFEWSSYGAPTALWHLLDDDVKALVATQTFSASSSGEPNDSAADSELATFPLGTVVIPTGIQTLEPTELAKALEGAAKASGVDIVAIGSGLTPDGIDLGSPSLRLIRKPNVALVVGRQVNPYEAGQAWHLLDHRHGIETVLLDRHRLARTRLERFTHVVMVDGDWANLDQAMQERLAGWIKQGGVIVAIKKAAIWADSLIPSEDPEDVDEPPVTERLPYGERQTDAAAKLISGSIFEADIDLTHPLAYGLSRRLMPVFRNSALVLEPPKNPYSTVAAYTDDPLLSGYISPDNLDMLRGTPSIIARGVGRGALIQMVDDPNFRAFWYGTNKFFVNAIFWGQLLGGQGPQGDEH